MNILVDVSKKKEDMRDLFGIFFEDLNHAADGGLYAEMVQNRSFEFDAIDNASYSHMTAWEVFGIPAEKYAIEKEDPYTAKNPHYLRVSVDGECEVVNSGFNTGFYIRMGAEYDFSVYLRTYDSTMSLEVCVRDEHGEDTEVESISVQAGVWKKYEARLTGKRRTCSGKLVLKVKGNGKLDIDHVSLFPTDTFLGKKNGLRDDIAGMLKDLKPRFMRFPGGCLVHDGSLDPEARDSMYRWKNTLGEVWKRPARKSNWGYNQTLGLGYYEYFCFSEEIGATPIPVVPGGYNPHRQEAVPIDELQPWIDDALDLIEFANGGTDTKWGSVREKLGHKEPFNLRYIAIGNEEVGEKFFERYPYFQKAIREKYPEIKIIGTSGPFAAGGEFERGWESARKNGADLVDEHYYMAPEWFLANMDRYADYDRNDPKVFLGEYATWGNTWYNALVEAAYMVKLQENAAAVGLACYAPLLCNEGYVNWKPDMIWFDNHRVYGTPNYYVQKLFMNNHGDSLLDTVITHAEKPEVVYPVVFSGDVVLKSIDGVVEYSDIYVENNDNGEVFHFGDKILDESEKTNRLMTINAGFYTIHLKAHQSQGKRGFWVEFGKKDEDNKFYWELGGWQNLDAALCETINGRGACLTQSEFSVDYDHTYDVKIKVKGNIIEGYLDGELFQTVRVKPSVVEPLYVTSSIEETSGDVIIKCVNLSKKTQTAKFELAGTEDKSHRINIEEIKGAAPDAENSFDVPERVSPKSREIKTLSNIFDMSFEKESVTVLRIRR